MPIEDYPYAKAIGPLSPLGDVEVTFYDTMANGSCFYHALPATIHKAFSGIGDPELESRLGQTHARTARLLLTCCDRAVLAKTEKEGATFRAFLAKHLKSAAKIPEVAHALAAIHVPEEDQQITVRGRRNNSSNNSINSNLASLARHVQVSTYADEITMEIIKAVFPFLNIILVVSVGSRDGQLWTLLGRAEPEVPAVYHFATMDITPCSTYSGQRMGVILHFLESGGKNGNLNHYECTELLNKQCHWLADQYGKKQATLNHFLTSNAWKVGSEAGESSKLGPVRCTKCGFPGAAGREVYICTKAGCTEALCYKQLGLKSPVECPNGYTCPEHRTLQPVLKFVFQKNCFECDADQGLVLCTVCGLKLCPHHAMWPAGIRRATEEDSLCRSCRGDEKAFEKTRLAAAQTLLNQIVGGKSIEELNWWDLSTTEAALRNKKERSKAEWKKACSAADRLGDFVYSLLLCGLGMLARSLIRILMLINLAMYNIASTMELRPFQVFFMLCADTRMLCDGRMLALVVQTFSNHIIEGERRRLMMKGARVFPALEWDKVNVEGKINIAFCGHNLVSMSPTHDLTYGTISHFLESPQYNVWLVVRTDLKEQEGKDGRHPYNSAYPPVVDLVKKCGHSRIVYIWEDWNDGQAVDAIRALNLDVAIHVNGLNYGHFWHILLMAEVAKLYLEWLAFASLLLSRSLAHWTLSCLDLVSKTQLGMPNREPVVLGCFPYPNEAYYQQIINSKGNPPTSQRGPCLIFTGGLERLTLDTEFLYSVVDILHRSPAHPRHGKPKFLVQPTPTSKVPEVRKLIKDYCNECRQSEEGWTDLSDLLVTYPFFDQKSELIEFFWENGDLLLAVAGGSVRPHTRAIDCTHGGIPTLDLTPPDAEWQARVVSALNNELHVGHVLNTMDRETFTERGVRLLSEPKRIAALRAHILGMQKAQQLFFDSTRFSVYLQAVIPHLLDKIQTARKEGGEVRTKLDDYHYKPQPTDSWPQFGWPQGISNLGENAGMESNRILAVLCSRGRSFKKVEAQFLAIMERMRTFATFETVAGIGGARVALAFRLNEPQTDFMRCQFRSLELGVSQLVTLKVELFKESNPCTSQNIHNSEIVRDSQLIERVTSEMDRLGPMRKCIPRLLPLFQVDKACAAAVGVARRSSAAQSSGGESLLPFMLCEHIAGDLGHSKLLSDVQEAWAQRGEINDHTRMLALMILHTAHFMQHFIGLVLMDHSYGNVFLLHRDETMSWVDSSTAKILSGPGGVAWCDLGAAIYIGPWNKRLDGRVTGSVPLARSNTDASGVKCSTNTKAKQKPTLVRLNCGGSEIGLLPKSKLQECEVRRAQIHGGLGRPEGATRGFHDTVMRERWRRSGDIPLSIDDILSWESFGNGALIYGMFCPRRKGFSIQQYLEEQQRAAESPEAMLETMKSYVDRDAEVQQPQTLALWANLLFHLMRPDIEQRMTVQKMRLHPAVTQRTLSLDEWQAVNSEEGYIFPAGKGPAGSPWAEHVIPGWTVKLDGHRGPGAFALQPIHAGQLAGLYAAVEYNATLPKSGDLSEYPPCRSNVSVNDGVGNETVKQVALGILPLVLMRELCSVGTCFNAGDTTGPSNLRLDRRLAWTGSTGPLKGITLIPFYVLHSADIKEKDAGLWKYSPFNGKGGIDSYTFEDGNFQVDETERRSSGADREGN